MKEQLLELMQTTADNGQPVWDWDAQELAWEIQAYVDEFAEADENQMIAAIKEIQKERAQ
jgi:hypothetical protein